MNDFRSNRVDRVHTRPQHMSAQFSVHEDAEKENRGAGLINRINEGVDPLRFRKTSPISRKRTSGSGWMGGRHVMSERENGQSSARSSGRQWVAEDTIVVEPARNAKSVYPTEDFQDVESDGVEDESQFPGNDEEETEMIDLAEESDYEESNRQMISKEKEGGVEQQRRRNSDATRNARAYSRMIEGAVPHPSPSKLRPVPPSRKRPREIHESGTSSSNEPISPRRYINSPPQKLAKRACTPPSSNRRKSAPSNLERSPVRQYENMKEPVYPDYILAGVQKLRDRYEGANFELGDTSITCIDCDRLFNVAKRNFNGPEKHCQSAPHKKAVEARIQQKKCDISLKPVSKTMDFDVPPQPPITALDNHGYAGFSNPFADVFTALQKSSTQTVNQNMVTTQRIIALEKQLAAQNEHLTALLSLSQASELKYQAIAKKQRNTEMTLDNVSQTQMDIADEFKKELADLEERLLQHGESTKDQFSALDKRVNDTSAKTSKFAALENRFVKSRVECQSDLNTLGASTMEATERNKQQLSTINKELAAAIKSNSEQIQDTRHDITPLNKHMSEQLKQNFEFDSKLKHHRGFISEYNAQNYPRLVTLEDFTRYHGNYIDQLQQKVTNLETRAGHAQNFEAATRNEVKRLRESGKKIQRDVQTLRSPSTLQNQQPLPRGLNQNAPNQSALNQIGAQLATSLDAKFKFMETSFQAQITSLQEESKNKISRLEAQTVRQAQLVQTLKKENKKLWSCIKATNEDVKEVIECFNESLPELEEKIDNIQQDLEDNSSLPSHLRNSSSQGERSYGPQGYALEAFGLEARFKRIETAIPALFEETSDLRDCFVDLVREEEVEEDDDDVQARLNRIEVTLPAVLEEAAGLRACVDDLGEIVEREMDDRSVFSNQDETRDQEEWEGGELESQDGEIKGEDYG